MVYGESLRIDKKGNIDKKDFLGRLKGKKYKILINKMDYTKVDIEDYRETIEKMKKKTVIKTLVFEDEMYRFTLLVNGAEYKDGSLFFELYRSKSGTDFNNSDIFQAFENMDVFIRSLSILRYEIPEKLSISDVRD